MNDKLAAICEHFGLDPAALADQKGPVDIFEATRADLAALFARLNFKQGVEVGVERGEYSEVLLKANPSLTLTSVDAWLSYRGYRDHKSQSKLDRFQEEARERLSAYGGRSRIVKQFSVDACAVFPNSFFDFCYIDCNHQFDWVMEDIINWGRRVRSGGIISGHDYIRRKNEPVHVVPAVHAYLDGHNIRPFFTVGGASKETRSWFFLKP